MVPVRSPIHLFRATYQPRLPQQRNPRVQRAQAPARKKKRQLGLSTCNNFQVASSNKRRSLSGAGEERDLPREAPEAWQEHGKSMARAWQGHGKSMARAWQEHDKSLARA